MKKFGSTLIILASLTALMLLPNGALAATDDLTNPGFEQGNLTDWDSYVGYGSIEVCESFKHSYRNEEYTPVEGSYFALLESGLVNAYTTVSQSFVANAGQTISGWAFFATLDGYPYNDNSYVRIKDAEGVVVAELFNVSVSDVGVNGYTEWTALEYTFASMGTYIIEAGVCNIKDSNFNYNSYLGLDLLELGQAGPSGWSQGNKSGWDNGVPSGLDKNDKTPAGFEKGNKTGWEK